MLTQKVLTLLLALQQVEVQPYPAEAGEQVVVTTNAPARAGIEIEVEQPDGTMFALAPTDRSGSASWRPTQIGTYHYRAVIDGVRVVAPHVVVQATSRWLYAAVLVPLGVGLLWVHWRDSRRNQGNGQQRASGPQDASAAHR